MKKYFLLLLFALVIIIVFTGCDSPWVFPTPNNGPLITSVPITSASVGINYTYHVEASDEDGDTLVYSLSTKPAGMTISSSSGLINWTPTAEGSYQIIVKVSDGKSTDTQTFNINVSTETTTSKRVVMWELFEGTSCSRCEKVHPAIVRLRGEYGLDELVILEEYGWNGDYEGWAVIDVGRRLWNYLSYLGIVGHFPDAYFNGINQVVHYESGGYTNYKTAIEAELAKPAQIAITATYSVIGQTVNIDGHITNISSETLSSIVIEGMVYEDSVYSEYREQNVDHVVRDIITYEESGELITSFARGESHSFSLTSSYLSNVHNMSNIHVVVYVQAPNSSTKEILQALYLE